MYFDVFTFDDCANWSMATGTRHHSPSRVASPRILNRVWYKNCDIRIWGSNISIFIYNWSFSQASYFFAHVQTSSNHLEKLNLRFSAIIEILVNHLTISSANCPCSALIQRISLTQRDPITRRRNNRPLLKHTFHRCVFKSSTQNNPYIQHLETPITAFHLVILVRRDHEVAIQAT